MKIVALDLSLSATGVADETGARTIRPKTTGMERLYDLRFRVLDVCHPDGAYRTCVDLGSCQWPHPDLVVIEGYSMGTARQNSHAHALGELGGVVRLALWETGIPYVDVPPACLKKYACGKGNAGKAEVMMAAGKRLGYDGHDDNESDALWLWHMAMDFYGSPVVKMPETHRVALTSVTWPEVAAAVSA